MDKTIRCVQCRAEFSDEEIAEKTACPTCGTRSKPSLIEDDKQITINTYELRILTIWASFWASHVKDKDERRDMERTLSSIINRLREQLPGVGFTLCDDVKEAANESGCDITVLDSDGSRYTVKPEKPS